MLENVFNRATADLIKKKGGQMLDHIFLTVADVERSIAFYEKTLAPLGIEHAIDYDGVVLSRRGQMRIARAFQRRDRAGKSPKSRRTAEKPTEPQDEHSGPFINTQLQLGEPAARRSKTVSNGFSPRLIAQTFFKLYHYQNGPM
jgi:hypothetical protein